MSDNHDNVSDGGAWKRKEKKKAPAKKAGASKKLKKSPKKK
jgi:hypothetical protein